MRQDARSEVLLMVPFDLGHGEQTVHELRPACTDRETRGGLVLHDVPAFPWAPPDGGVDGRGKRGATQGGTSGKSPDLPSSESCCAIPASSRHVDRPTRPPPPVHVCRDGTDDPDPR